MALQNITRQILHVATRRRTDWLQLTDLVQGAIEAAGLRDGAALVFVPHTTAGITINENADPDVASDMMRFLDHLAPQRHPAVEFRHAEGNSDSHIKASFMGSSVRVMVERGRLCLGRWQGIFLCEFDGPRQREVWVKPEPDAATVKKEAAQ